ncbi:TBC1 domain family member 30-like isoform X2 [Tachypleus tridentatus]|uniref:TBC1 domain family member 30-like isoform X2 n=1 Tax=Tachypleus tridentatus TaxID=6853 RepID=UPI003FD085BA
MTSNPSTVEVQTTTKGLSDIPLTPPSSPELPDCLTNVEPEFVENFQNFHLPALLLEKPDSERSTLQTWECHLNRQDDRYVQHNPNRSATRTLEAKPPEPEAMTVNKKRIPSIVDGLLVEIYNRRYSADSDNLTDSSVSDVFAAPQNFTSDCESHHSAWYSKTTLYHKGVQELVLIKSHLLKRVHHLNNRLVCRLKLRDHFQNKRNRKYDVITAILQAISQKRRIDTRIRFTLEPFPGETGFSQWHDAMKMVVRLPARIPSYFRKRLWLTLASRYVNIQKIDWNATKQFCFNDKSNPDDDRLGTQIIKDLHRTGCSLFSSEACEFYQALLKRVLLAYARWNKRVGYCQGLNMLAAIILEVMEWKEEEAFKVMIFLIESVLPSGYFADNLRGLSVDMAVFRELLDARIPELSRHLENLQLQARVCSTGTNYEPPLTNVFTMQWFLTLFSTCLPKSTVLKVWDLVFLEGNEVLLKTALAMWEGLSHGYFLQKICTMEPFLQLTELRDKYNYNIYPLPPCDSDNDVSGLSTSKEWCLSTFLNMTSFKGTSSKTLEEFPSRSTTSDSSQVMSFSNTHVERTSLDISALKRQYIKLCEQQRQAHIVLTGDFRESTKLKQKTSMVMNHLLLKRKPLVSKYKNGMQTRFILKTPICSKNCVQQLVPKVSLSGANMLMRIPGETEYDMKKSLVEVCNKLYSNNLSREVKEKLEALESTVDFLDVRLNESEDDSDNNALSVNQNILK